MSETTHTPGPWKSNHKGEITSGDLHSADGADRIGKIDFYRNARRIVACVNACEGISTEELEGGKIAALQAENARLRELVKNLSEHAKRISDDNYRLLEGLNQALNSIVPNALIAPK